MEELVGVIVLVITVISWIVQVAGGTQKAADAPPVRNAPKPRPQRPRQPPAEEISTFLEEVRSAQTARETPPSKSNDSRGNKPPRQQPKPAREPRPRGPQGDRTPEKRRHGTPETASSRPGEQLSHRHMASSNLGAGIGQHVTEHLQQGQIGKQVAQHLDHRIDREVQADLGTPLTQSGAATEVPDPAAAPLLKLLLQPQNLRQAIVLQEIFTRPSLRRPRHSR